MNANQTTQFNVLPRKDQETVEELYIKYCNIYTSKSNTVPPMDFLDSLLLLFSSHQIRVKPNTKLRWKIN